MRQNRPDHPCHLVGERDDHDIRWATPAHLLNPSARTLGVTQHGARAMDQLYERVPFEQALVCSGKQVDRGSISGLVAALSAAAHYEIR